MTLHRKKTVVTSVKSLFYHLRRLYATTHAQLCQTFLRSLLSYVILSYENVKYLHLTDSVTCTQEQGL